MLVLDEQSKNEAISCDGLGYVDMSPSGTTSYVHVIEDILAKKLFLTTFDNSEGFYNRV